MSRRNRLAVPQARGHHVESLEARRMLSAAVLNLVPPSIDPVGAEQALFGLGRTRLAFPSSPGQRFLEFALDTQVFADQAAFEVRPANGQMQSDAAVALYDRDGNLIAKADADLNPGGLPAFDLALDLQGRRPYILGLFFGPSSPPGGYELSVAAGAQVVNATIAIDPATGLGEMSGLASEDSFNTPADVDYFPLNLENAGNGATVTVTPTGLDVRASAAIYRRGASGAAWELVASGADAAGNPVVLNLVSPAGTTLSDGEYLLATAPMGFDTPARGYRVDIAASSLVGPASADAGAALDLLTLPPVSLGVVGADVGGVLAVGGEGLYAFRVPVGGLATASIFTGAFDGALSLYDAGGTLLDVATEVVDGQVSTQFEAQAGATYIVRIGDVGADEGGTYAVSLRGAYVPTAVTLAQPYASVGPIAVGAGAAAAYYRLAPAASSDVLVIEADSTVAASLGIVGENMVATLRPLAVGRTRVVVDLAESPGAVDVYVAGATAGSVTLRIAQLAVPDTLSVNALTSAEVELNGNVPGYAIPAGAFGAATGIRFYQQFHEAGVNTLALAATGGAASLLAHYVAEGGVLKLKGYVLPAADGTALLAEDLAGSALHGMAAISIAIDGGGMNALSMAGPDLVGVGVGMVPDPPPPVPGSDSIDPDYTPPPPPSDPANFYSWLKIRNVVLAKNYERDFWTTILPLNMIGNPRVDFIPTQGGPLRVDMDIYDEDPTNPGVLTYIGQLSNNAGANASFNISNYASRQGHRIHFHIRPLGNDIGDGMYTLQMQVETTNPHPYEVLESQWDINAAGRVVYSGSQNEVVQDIFQNQFGDGRIQSNFTTSTPFMQGSIDVFRFWVQTEGPVIVRTVAIDPLVNTNIKLYRAIFDASGNIDRIQQMQDVPVSFDWMPADRSEVDAQVYVNNYDLLRYTGGANHYGNGFGMYFAVVKNQEGSTGRYAIEVDAPDFPLLGAVGTPPTTYAQAMTKETAYFNAATGGSIQLKPQFTEGITDFVGYFPIQLPDYHDGTLGIESAAGYWDYNVFDSAGRPIRGTVQDVFGIPAKTVGNFQPGTGPRILYLRAGEQSAVSNASATLTLTTDVDAPAGTSVPPGIAPPVTAVMTNVNPFGDSLEEPGRDNRTTGTMFAINNERAYAFKAPAGPLTVSVTPSVAGGVALQWGVYVNGQLKAWDQTRVENGAHVAASLTTTLLMPEFREAGADPIKPYETAQMHDVVVYVKAITAPTQGGGGFTVAIDGASALPHATTLDVRFDTLLNNPSVDRTTDGTKWMRVFVPDNTTGGLDVVVGSGSIGSSRYRYDLYSHDGQHLVSGVAVPQVFGLAGFTLTQATGGAMYFLRVGVEGSATAATTAVMDVTLPKANGEKPVDSLGLNEAILRRTSPTPDGSFRYYTVQKPDPVSNPKLVQYDAFWVDQGGPVHIEGNFPTPGTYNSNTPNMTFAVYRIDAHTTEFLVHDLTLIDYANDSNLANGRYALDTYLDPGAYVLRVLSPLNNTSGGAVDYTLPEYRIEEAVLDPNFGTNALVHLQAVDRASGGFNLDDSRIVESFRTRFVHATAPEGTLGPFSALAVAYTVGGIPEDHEAYLSLLDRDAGGTYHYLANTPGTDSKLESTVNDVATVQPLPPPAVPGKDYWMVLNRKALAGNAGLGLNFAVPVSGTPDLVVQEIELSPNNGETRVDVTIYNMGYAPTLLTHSLFAFTDTTKSPDLTTSSELLELPVAPLGSHHWTLPWLPVAPEDYVQFTADHDSLVEELSETNNKPATPKLLSTVDPTRPTIQLQLADSAMDGNSAAGVWGRYIAGVNARDDIRIISTDPDGDLYNGFGYYPYDAPSQSQSGQPFPFHLDQGGTQQEVRIKNFNFGELSPTSGASPNKVRFFARDAYGLVSDWAEKTLQVVPMPDWLNNDSSEIVFNKDAHKYELDFKNEVLRREGTLDQITGATIPFVGDKNNLFLIELGSEGSVSLNPAQEISLPVTAHAQIVILGETIIDEYWDGSGSPTDHVQIETLLVVDPLTVDADQFNVTFRLVNLPLFNYQSPKIPLFAYGVPGVAAISANLSFGVSATLNAALTIAIQTDPNDPLNISRVGLAAPTFIMPTITTNLTISGDVTFIGFDLASISGSVFFALNLGYGLDESAPSFVPFEDFFDESCLDITGNIGGSIAAEIIGIEIFEIDFPTVTIDFTEGCDIQTMMVQQVEAALAQAAASLPGGNDPVGNLNIHESPQLAIDPITGDSMYVQVIDSSGAGALRYASAPGGAWPGALANLPVAGHATSPRLEQTHDAPGAPAVVVYQAHSSTTPSTLTRNQYLTGQDLRYRYYNGANWSAEQSIAPDSLYDFDHDLSFNSAGHGVLAWTRNRNATPLDANGALDRDRNEIMVSLWDGSSHAWAAPLALTNDDAADAAPAVHMAEDGTALVVWKRGDDALYFARYAGGAWSAPAPLPIVGLPPGGTIRSLSVGADGSGKVSVVFGHEIIDPATTEVDSRLYARTTTLAGFGNPAWLEQIAFDANYGQLDTTRAPDGALVAYWSQSTGDSHDLYASRIGGGSGVWSAPMRLTASTALERDADLAVRPDGTYAIVYESVAPDVTAPLPLPDSPWDFPVDIPPLPPLPQPIGIDPVPLPIPVAGDVDTAAVGALPELSFSRSMVFPFQDQAPAGAHATAEATLVNRGLAATQVKVVFLDITGGDEVQLGSQELVLSPGATYDLSFAYPVAFGPHTYAMRAIAVGGDEAIGTADNLTSATLTGLPDIAVTSVTVSDPQPYGGDTIDVIAEVRNLSDQPIGQFVVSFYAQDWSDPNSTPSLLGQEMITLAAYETRILKAPWTVLGGSYVLSAVADEADVIPEATEFNNRDMAVVTTRPDAAVEDAAAEVIPAALLTGHDNVRVTAMAYNRGKADLSNVTVHLLWSLDGSDYQLSRSMVIPSLPAGGRGTAVSFIADGLAGMNDYRILIDPLDQKHDRDRSNNAADATLILQGLPDLMIESYTLDDPTPVQGHGLNLNTTLFNLGIAKAESVLVEVIARPAAGSVGGGLGGIVIGQVLVPLLPALGQMDLVIPLDTHELSGAYEICVVADRPQDILEVTDLNNEACARVNIQPGGRIIEGTDGDDRYWVRLDASGKNIEIFHNVPNAPQGTPTFTYAAASTTPLTFASLAGNDELVIEVTTVGVPIGPGGLYFNADGDSDQIVVLGAPGADSFSMTHVAMLIGGGIVGYAGVERVLFDGRGGYDTVAVGSEGALGLIGPQELSSLTISGDGSVNIAAGGSNLLFTQFLGITGHGTLDLADNPMIVQPDNGLGPTVLDEVFKRIASARNSSTGLWTGHGITSSRALADDRIGIGSVLNGLGGGKQLYDKFAGRPVNGDAVLLLPALEGDLDLDDDIDGDDYFMADNGFLAQLFGYAAGDVNYDRLTDGDDFHPMDRNYLNKAAKAASVKVAGGFASTTLAPAALFNAGSPIAPAAAGQDVLGGEADPLT